MLALLERPELGDLVLLGHGHDVAADVVDDLERPRAADAVVVRRVILEVLLHQVVAADARDLLARGLGATAVHGRADRQLRRRIGARSGVERRDDFALRAPRCGHALQRARLRIDDEREPEVRLVHEAERRYLRRPRRIEPVVLRADARAHDDVVEVARVRQLHRGFDDAVAVHERRLRLDAERAQHRDQQQALVLAVPEASFEHEVRRPGPVRSGADLDARVAHFALHETQRREQPRLGAGVVPSDALDLRAQRRACGGTVVERVRPACDRIPVGERAPLDPRVQVAPGGRVALDAERREHVATPAQVGETPADDALRLQVAVHRPDRERVVVAMQQPQAQLEQRLFPLQVVGAEVASVERGIHALYTVRILDDVADPHVAEQDGRRLAAVEDAALQVGFTSEDLHVRRVDLRQAATFADHREFMQHERLERGIERDLDRREAFDAGRAQRLRGDVAEARARAAVQPRLVVEQDVVGAVRDLVLRRVELGLRLVRLDPRGHGTARELRGLRDGDVSESEEKDEPRCGGREPCCGRARE